MYGKDTEFIFAFEIIMKTFLDQLINKHLIII